MASSDWMESAEFIIDLIKVVQDVKKNKRLDCDTGELVLWLYNKLQETKSKRTLSDRVEAAMRSKEDALRSASILVEGAFSRGIKKFSSRVDERLLSESYEEKFCTVWPFCNSGGR